MQIVYRMSLLLVSYSSHSIRLVVMSSRMRL